MNTTENGMVGRREDVRAVERTQERPTVTPPVDIYENADEILLVADLPGVVREGVTIDLDKEQLTLTARREEVAQGTRVASDATPSDYYRAFLVPPGIDAEKITAELDRGVLRVRLPKSAAVKPRRIEVKAG